MKRETIRPTVTEAERNSTYIEHPAFGMIRASRVSGNASLFGSDFVHHNYVTITICKAKTRRELSTDWDFAGDELIEVNLSEAQWATFVSSMNVGSGVTCTIDHILGEYLPFLPQPEQSNQQFKDEMQQQMADMQKELQSMASTLEGAISKTKATELKTRMERLSSRLTGNLGFVAKQFDEHMERITEKAKIEINAHAINLVHQAGLEALANRAPAISYTPEEKK